MSSNNSITLSKDAQKTLDALVADLSEKLPTEERIYRKSNASAYLYNYLTSRVRYRFSFRVYNELFKFLTS